MKIFIAILAIFSALGGSVIDGVAIKVNGNIITLYEIQKLQDSLKISREESVERIILEKIKENEIKRLGIVVTDEQVNEEISAIIANNKITQETLIEALKAQGMDFETYKKDMKTHLINRNLTQRILQSNATLADEEDLLEYYETHKNEFMFPTRIKVTSYSSNSDVALQQFLSNPLSVNPNVEMKDEEIDTRNLPAQIMSIFIETPERKFTPVLNSGSTLIVFFIKEKLDKELVPFDDIKPNVMQRYSQAKESEILSEYFNRIKASSTIEIVRE